MAASSHNMLEEKSERSMGSAIRRGSGATEAKRRSVVGATESTQSRSRMARFSITGAGNSAGLTQQVTATETRRPSIGTTSTRRRFMSRKSIEHIPVSCQLIIEVKPLILPPHPITPRKLTDIHGLLYRLGLVRRVRVRVRVRVSKSAKC